MRQHHFPIPEKEPGWSICPTRKISSRLASRPAGEISEVHEPDPRKSFWRSDFGIPHIAAARKLLAVSV